jgi:hypothetical protein
MYSKNFAIIYKYLTRMLSSCLMVVVLILPIACSHVGKQTISGTEVAVSSSDGLRRVDDRLGIEIVAMRLSAEGYMLDFRYRCLEPEKTEILFSRQIKPYLVHEATGAKFQVPNPPKVGPMRQTTNKPIAGKEYFMIFANPGHYIKVGEQVTIAFGDFRIEHLIVE